MFDISLIFGFINDKFIAQFRTYKIYLDLICFHNTNALDYALKSLSYKNVCLGSFLRHDMPFIKIVQSDPTLIIILIGENEGRR